jgi:hypothetical protein
MSYHGRISSRFQGNELNEVNSNSVSILGGDTPMELEYKAGKEVIIPLSLAVARENNRGSITSAQRARRATAGLGLGLGSELGLVLAIASDGDIVDAIATATDAVLGVANALANSLVRQRRWRPDPSPESSPN